MTRLSHRQCSPSTSPVLVMSWSLSLAVYKQQQPNTHLQTDYMSGKSSQVIKNFSVFQPQNRKYPKLVTKNRERFNSPKATQFSSKTAMVDDISSNSIQNTVNLSNVWDIGEMSSLVPGL